MARRSGLGRGLDALIPTGVTQSSSSALRDVPLSSIRPNQFQPRKQFDEETLSTLVDSIRAIGVLQPVLLREVAAGEYELIAGERRWRASRRAGLQTIPALVQVADDVSSLEQALVENLHREDLNPLDEAAAYQQLIEDFHLTHEDVARRVGKSRAAITNSLRLFHLPPTVQRLVRDTKLTPGHARALLTTPDRELQERLAQEAAAASLSVRALEELVRAYVHDEAMAAVVQAVPVETRSHEAAPEGDSESEDDDAPPLAEDDAPSRPTATVSTRRDHLPSTATALRPPGVLELEELLAAHLDTRVRVDMGARRGRIVVDFATLEDLERIYRAMIGGLAR
ncbi:MAG: chromosome segregation DNA-binding protein [Acidimicrobiaceae bacterium]|nr:chromosome segregation DNA-binding protein [Acidimicrobiaceae bacterium]